MENLTGPMNILNDVARENTTVTESKYPFDEMIDRWSLRAFLRLFINLFLSPTVIIVGIIGNVLTVKIFKIKRNKSSSTYFILCLAIADLLLLIIKFIYVLYIIGFIIFPQTIQNIPIRSMSWFYLADIPERIGKLLTIAIMVERIYAVYFPLLLKHVWTTGRTKKIATVIVVLIMLTSIPPYIDVLYFFLVDRTNHSEDFTTIQEGELYLKNVSHWMEKIHLLNVLIFDMASLLIIFVLCIITSIGVRRVSNDLSLSNVVIQQRKRRERKITITMLTMSLLFCLFCSPLSILGILVYVGVINSFDVPIEVTGLTYLLLHLNSMVNFIIYGVSERTLRREYCMLVKCCTIGKRKSSQQEYQLNSIHEKFWKETSIQAIH